SRRCTVRPAAVSSIRPKPKHTPACESTSRHRARVKARVSNMTIAPNRHQRVLVIFAPLRRTRLSSGLHDRVTDLTRSEVVDLERRLENRASAREKCRTLVKHNPVETIPRSGKSTCEGDGIVI